jgi:hypothetical protein
MSSVGECAEWLHVGYSTDNTNRRIKVADEGDREKPRRSGAAWFSVPISAFGTLPLRNPLEARESPTGQILS